MKKILMYGIGLTVVTGLSFVATQSVSAQDLTKLSSITSDQVPQRMLTAAQMQGIERTAMPMAKHFDYESAVNSMTTQAPTEAAETGPISVRTGWAGPESGAEPNLEVVTMEPVNNGGIGTQDYGTGVSINPVFHYTDKNVSGMLTRRYPERVTGKWFFGLNGGDYYCTASMIDRSIMVTAGHCVKDGGGAWLDYGYFVPSYRHGKEPYKRAFWTAIKVAVGWLDGNLGEGDDVAVVALGERYNTNNVLLGGQIGTYTGWNAMCISNCLQPYWYLTQFGYAGNYGPNGRAPIEGQHLEVNQFGLDYVYGSGQEGGSSGGPHVANYGDLKYIASEVGSWYTRNVTFAVTSWGYIAEEPNVQGASPLSGPANVNDFPTMFNWACGFAQTQHGADACTML